MVSVKGFWRLPVRCIFFENTSGLLFLNVLWLLRGGRFQCASCLLLIEVGKVTGGKNLSYEELV